MKLPAEGAIPDAMPEVKHESGLFEYGLTNDGWLAFALDNGLEITQQMSPAELPAGASNQL